MQKVLVVEDDDAIREAVVDALRQAGYGVLEARDGDDGLRAALNTTSFFWTCSCRAQTAFKSCAS